MLHQAHCRALREDRQNVKPELGGELEARENQNPGEQAPVFGEPLCFVRLLSAQVLQKLQILDFPPELGVSADGVVIGQGNRVETAVFGTAQDVEDADFRLLVISRSRSVDVKVDASPREILRIRGAEGARIAGC